MTIPETRASLLRRISDPSNAEAWQEFAEIYRPVVINLATQRGMQPADAEDLAQAVLMSVASAIEKFEPDHSRAKFRTWLQTIARNAIINALSRAKPDVAEGGSEVLANLHQQPQHGEITETIRLDYRREIFLIAAKEIRPQFEPDTWQSFWQTVVEGKPIGQVAETLGRSSGSIYTARSRVLRKLRSRVQQLDGEQS